jgi:hypothetical protein
MIRINSDHNNEEKLQHLLDVIYNKIEYYNGSLHENVEISKIVDCIYQTLFVENKSSINLIIEKNPNNSLDLIIDVIK